MKEDDACLSRARSLGSLRLARGSSSYGSVIRLDDRTQVDGRHYPHDKRPAGDTFESTAIDMRIRAQSTGLFNLGVIGNPGSRVLPLSSPALSSSFDNNDPSGGQRATGTVRTTMDYEEC